MRTTTTNNIPKSKMNTLDYKANMKLKLMNKENLQLVLN